MGGPEVLILVFFGILLLIPAFILYAIIKNAVTAGVKAARKD